MLNIEDYDYKLPPSIIAQVPTPKRDQSRLLVVDRFHKSYSHKRFFDLPALLSPGDLVVVNDTRVVPARLFGRKESGGRVEVFVLEHPESINEGAQTRLCLLRSSKGPKKGTLLFFESEVSGVVEEVLEDGVVRIRFSGTMPLDAVLDQKGQIPLPPYIRRQPGDTRSLLDKERYQTVFSRKRGAVAAPTAGLHFTRGLLAKMKRSGIALATLTLHVGYGTFRPVRTKDIRNHGLGEESFRIPYETVAAIAGTRKAGGRVVAVGTTVVRALETAVLPDGSIQPGEGKTNLLITPGFSFAVVDALITNFHLPKSSLLFLVSAFAGFGLTRQAYKLAVEKRYRFYSYGDAMLVL